MRAVYYLSIDGVDVTSNFDPVLVSLTITDSEGGKADSLEVQLDDEGGQILLPQPGAQISAGVGWEDSGPAVQFDGYLDEPTSTGARGQGLLLTISAKSADLRGKLKTTRHKHKDKGSFKDAATEFAKGTGVTVHVDDSLAAVSRDYWRIGHESFPAWGERIAREIGATFKIMGDKAVFVARSAGKSASGKPLKTIEVQEGVNLISHSLAPTLSRPAFQKFKTRWYDWKKAKYVEEEVEAKPEEGFDGSIMDRFPAPDADHAKKRAGSNKAESDRDKGGGTVTIDGAPDAFAECLCEVSGIRDGIDGAYRVSSARHKLTRSAGYTTELTLKQPAGSAGTDARDKPKKPAAPSTSSPSSPTPPKDVGSFDLGNPGNTLTA